MLHKPDGKDGREKQSPLSRSLTGNIHPHAHDPPHMLNLAHVQTQATRTHTHNIHTPLKSFLINMALRALQWILSIAWYSHSFKGYKTQSKSIRGFKSLSLCPRPKTADLKAESNSGPCGKIRAANHHLHKAKCLQTSGKHNQDKSIHLGDVHKSLDGALKHKTTKTSSD